MQKVLCQGTVPGTSKKCEEAIFHTDGEVMIIVAPKSRWVKLEMNPLRLKCKRCGFRNKLDWKGGKKR